MCGRYLYFDGHNPIIAKFIDTAKEKLPEKTFAKISLFEVFPDAYVFAGIYDDHFHSRIMRWGLHMNKKLVINARCETIRQSLFFKDTKPCVLLCSGYYEWSKQPKEKYYFSLGEEPMYLAGVYRKEEGELRFAILTEEATGNYALIHNRQPVVLSKENAQAWCRETALPVHDYSIHERRITKESE